MRRARRRAAILCRAGLGLLAAIVVALSPTAAHADAGQLEVLGVDTSEAPNVTITVSTPPELASVTLDASSFEVRESGKLRKVQVTGMPTDPMQVVLAIDTSGSMRGPALDAAKAAATQFLQELPITVPVAVVGFGSTPYVVSAFTTDRGALAGAVAGLQATGQTALYDGTAAAARLFSGPGRRTLVLLSDGKDTASVNSLEQASTSLVGSAAAFYGVLLQTNEQGIPALDSLAAAAGGRVVAASDPEALKAVYQSIAAELLSQYQLVFRARGTGSIGFTVRAESADAAAEGSARALLPAADAPRARAPTAPPMVEAAGDPGIFGQRGTLALGLAAIFVGLLVGALLMLQPGPERSQLTRGRQVRSGGGGRISALADRTTLYVQGRLERSGRERSLNIALERAGIAMRPAEFVVVMITAAFSALAIVSLLTNLLVGLVAAGLTLLAARWVVSHQANRRSRRFGDQLEETLPLISSSLRAGFGLMHAIDAVASESESPTAEEFRRVVTESWLGRDLTGSLEAMAERVDNDDFRWVVQAIEIHRQVGGDLVEVLDNVEATIRDRNQIRRNIRALSAEGVLSAIILFVLPFAMVVALQVVNPGYLHELTSSTIGLMMLGGAGVLMLVGGLWLRRITRLVF
ncbi:MAG: VWA domain-containing protein [Actinobacteria bacterium]|nr:VWA domain-containing protein [Actinomycetota bacterium]